MDEEIPGNVLSEVATKQAEIPCVFYQVLKILYWEFPKNY